MTLKRIAELPRNEAARIRSRQNNGSMSVFFDEQNYICYDEEELAKWTKKKAGRKPKIGG